MAHMGDTPFVARPRRRSRRGARIAGAVVALAIAALFAGDWAVGRWQAHTLQQKAERRKQLEKMAWFYLRADVENVKYTGDGRYQVKVQMENAFPEHPLYVMLPTIRTFVQVGPQWQEVPGAEPPGTPWREGSVVKLEGRVSAERIADIQLTEHFELLPGYMHVRFENVMYVAAEAEPKDEVYERTDVYYIHLRPIGADDGKLRAMNKFPGPVPLYIGMPPH